MWHGSCNSAGFMPFFFVYYVGNYIGNNIIVTLTNGKGYGKLLIESPHPRWFHTNKIFPD